MHTTDFGLELNKFLYLNEQRTIVLYTLLRVCVCVFHNRGTTRNRPESQHSTIREYASEFNHTELDFTARKNSNSNNNMLRGKSGAAWNSVGYR